MSPRIPRWLPAPASMVLLAALACQPTVKLAAPDEPIVIDINIKIEQDVRVRVEREIDDLLRENEDLF